MSNYYAPFGAEAHREVATRGVRFWTLEEALEVAYTEHGLEWYESGAAYEYDSGEYEQPLNDWAALVWLFGHYFDLVGQEFRDGVEADDPDFVEEAVYRYQTQAITEHVVVTVSEYIRLMDYEVPEFQGTTRKETE